ncbi:hypothetical protein [Lewinella sp. 4G2]|uniref:hypothetical protein n=1 Tax=Lewinella sp. 4G2 TaxID=1803372 RepID=UPI0007B4B869|nr:hypothetical protein [Lewinella sp. 4G2]OAV45504.1 hypothetical protein A3850_013845 [Lewinella sp. 4G2]
MFLALCLCTCDSAQNDGFAELDLTKYNVPIKITAPDSAKVVSQSLSSVMHDVTIKSPEDNFDVQVLASKAVTNDMTRLKADQLENVRENRYFSSIVREEPNGFVFENKIDTLSTYGFRYIIYQGDQEFVFQNGFSGTYTQEEIERMYDAVKQQK